MKSGGDFLFVAHVVVAVVGRWSAGGCGGGAISLK